MPCGAHKVPLGRGPGIWGQCLQGFHQGIDPILVGRRVAHVCAVPWLFPAAHSAVLRRQSMAGPPCAGGLIQHHACAVKGSPTQAEQSAYNTLKREQRHGQTAWQGMCFCWVLLLRVCFPHPKECLDAQQGLSGQAGGG